MNDNRREYTVKIVGSPDELGSAERLAVDIFKWGGEYAPETAARMVWVRERGLLAEITCRETNPRRVYSNYYDPVYRDSCAEFFVTFNPERGYINFEINAAGALLAGFGRGRGDRVRIDSLTGKIPAAEAGIFRELWSARLFLPVCDIILLFGLPDGGFVPGYEFAGNFYKCGDDTAQPHWGMWNEVDSPKPDFHRPECFGRFVLG